MGEATLKAQNAKQAAEGMARLSSATRNAALEALAVALLEQTDYLVSENTKDVEAARKQGTAEPLIDRLLLNPQRISGIAAALKELALEKDPIGELTEGRTLYNGIQLRQVRVPLGVVAMIYEARPNVTADAAGLCLKTGNACLLRGGSLAVFSNLAMTKVLYEAGRAAGLPEHWLQSIETVEREATTELMQLHHLVDVLIPRGSASLIKSTIENSKVPVIETGEGNCHLYVHADTRREIIIPIMLNAKTQRPGVCNSIESILIDSEVASVELPLMLQALFDAKVLVHGDETVAALAESLPGAEDYFAPATEADWGTEYLDLEISIKCVSGVDEAIKHINTYSTHHSESILSENHVAVKRFFEEVDSAAVYANASTRFTDGGEFGLGAEIGISTQKLHARGPMGLTALTSSKFLLDGDGQIRG
ncbi:MAG: glutamate-5-semialdehyde dehydrogenase [Coriobacteriia bacterium]|nr:glutamate-5-semialdehyde dehydrogenase [Coriobacteriia bacterium]MCL2749458.1 glutamate-5-semialdehyde dehydrogenase [Coriobacteriia bacterium]